MLRGIRSLLLASCASVAAVAAAESPAEPRPFPAPCTLRVESELFVGSAAEPVARSLTLFHEGVAWDFLELPAADAADAEPMQLAEIVLHDPARERIVVIDPVRRLKTEIPLIRLERLSVSLARWARESDDRLVRWAGGPDFSPGIEDAEGQLELAGPRVRYAVAHVEAPSPEAAETYRRFADTAILLKALLQPGGIPPFPRLALNERLQDEAAIPAEVTLEIEPRAGLLAGGTDRFRSVHRSHPRLLAADQARLDEARRSVAAAERVGLAAFMDRPAVDRE
ncbi:MAG: hypothetical protein RLZZ440_200 [Planctomycetota bacterium]